MFRSCQIIIRELCCSLLNLYYNIHNLIRFCKEGVVAACHALWERVAERAVGYVCVVCYVMSPSLRIIRPTRSQLLSPQHIPKQHDMLPQRLVCKKELNCEYCNTTLARNNKAPWWWSDKIETCRSDFKCFESVLCESYVSTFVGW